MHTPGPWRIAHSGFEIIANEQKHKRYSEHDEIPTGMGVVAILGRDFWEARPANARLIARSTEMLDFIQRFECNGGCGRIQDWRAEARALLREIEG